MAPMLRTNVPPMSFACDPKTCSTRARTLAFVLFPRSLRLVSFFAADPFRRILLVSRATCSGADPKFAACRSVIGTHREAVGRVARPDHGVEDETARPGAQVQLVAELHAAPALDDDVGVGLEQAHHLLPGGDLLAFEHPAHRLVRDGAAELAEAGDVGAPALQPGLLAALDGGERAFRVAEGPPRRDQQLAVQLDLTLPPGLRDLPLPALRQPAVVVEGEDIGAERLAGPAEEARQHPHGVVQELAVAGLEDVGLRHRAVDAHPAALLDPVAPRRAQENPGNSRKRGRQRPLQGHDAAVQRHGWCGLSARLGQRI